MKKILFFGIAVLAVLIICGFAACSTDASDEDFGVPEIEMVDIQPGTFLMGSAAGEVGVDEERGERPQHEVTFTKGFQMGIYPITQGQYRAVTKKNPSLFQGKIMQGGVNILAGVNTDNLPVEQVSWYDAVEYCNRLSELQERTPAYTIIKAGTDPNNKNLSTADPKWTVTPIPGTNGYRLPTEAQWEYACRAGTTGPFNTGNNIKISQANFRGTAYIQGESEETYLGRTTEVDSFAPNAWGLYDMHGNVFELCWDRIWQPKNAINFDEWKNFYEETSDKFTDPEGLVSGDRRAERGGSYRSGPEKIRSAFRERIQPQDRKYGNGDLGFRVVLPLEGSTW